MFGHRLQIARKKLQLSQEDISTQIGISYRAYSSYEREDRKPPIDFLEKLITKFDMNLNWLVTGQGEMFINQQPSLNNDELEQKVVDVMKKYGVIEKWVLPVLQKV